MPEETHCEKGLQNLYSWVRFPPAPPIPSLLVSDGRPVVKGPDVLAGAITRHRFLAFRKFRTIPENGEAWAKRVCRPVFARSDVFSVRFCYE
jgi:hypothetical protein